MSTLGLISVDSLSVVVFIEVSLDNVIGLFEPQPQFPDQVRTKLVFSVKRNPRTVKMLGAFHEVADDFSTRVTFRLTDCPKRFVHITFQVIFHRLCDPFRETSSEEVSKTLP